MKSHRFNIPLAKPYITQYMVDSVTNTLWSGFLTEGGLTEQFEKSIANYCNVTNAIAVPNATIGLELALNNVVSDSVDVIIPSFTHPATALSIVRAGMRPALIDINIDTMLIDYDLLGNVYSDKVAAIMPVSLFGNPLNYSKLYKIDKDMHIIEDAACSIGSSYNGLKTGSLADVSVFSFHPRKIITTGEGGMILTNNTRINNSICKAKNFGTFTKIGDFDVSGSNYKMSDLQASLGFAQTMILDKIVETRQRLANRYTKAFEDISEITPQKTTTDGIHSYQTYCVLVKNRDNIMSRLRNIGIETQIGSHALHRCPKFLSQSQTTILCNLDNSEYVYNHSLALPLYYDMKVSDQNIVIKNLINLL
jgi:perosamine synthetase